MHLSGADDGRSGPELAIAIAWEEWSASATGRVSLAL
jgi:hypothetical protein